MFQRKTAGLVVMSLLGLATAKLDAQAKGPKATNASKDLKITMIDVEGGAAMLFVTPEGKSLLIDTGWPPGMGGPRAATRPSATPSISIASMTKPPAG